jgi:cell division protease FtsH
MSSETNQAFAEIGGYQEIKDELQELLDWYRDPAKLNNPSISLPRGVLFYGEAGGGKSLFAHAFANALGWPLFAICGEKEKSAEELQGILEKARQEKQAVVLLDELDLLLERDLKALRILRNAMDGGVAEANRLVYVATTNARHRLDPALLRSGRFERQIPLGVPSEEDSYEILNLYLRKLGASPIGKEQARELNDHHFAADLKALVNDAYIRKGSALTFADLKESDARLFGGKFQEKKGAERRYFIAIHEAGHCALVYHYRQYFAFERSFFSSDTTKDGGLTLFHRQKEREYEWGADEAEASVSLGGYYAEALFLKEPTNGAANDLQRFRSLIERMVNAYGYAGPEKTLPLPFLDDERKESQFRRYQNEKTIRRQMRRIAHKSRQILKQKKTLVLALADVMMKNGEITAADVERLVEN